MSQLFNEEDFQSREQELEKRLRDMIRMYEEMKAERDSVSRDLVAAKVRIKKLKEDNENLKNDVEDRNELRQELRSLRAYVRAMKQ